MAVVEFEELVDVDVADAIPISAHEGLILEHGSETAETSPSHRIDSRCQPG